MKKIWRIRGNKISAVTTLGDISRKSSPGRYSYVVQRVGHPVDEEAKPVRLPRRKSSPGRYSYVVHRVCHPGGRRSENSSTSSEKVVAGSIFIRGATSRPPGWTKKRNQFDFLGESRRRVDILTWCTKYVTPGGRRSETSLTSSEKVVAGSIFIRGATSRPPGWTKEAKPVRLPRRKSSRVDILYVVHQVCHPGGRKKRNQFDFLGESRRRVGYSYLVHRVGHPGRPMSSLHLDFFGGKSSRGSVFTLEHRVGYRGACPPQLSQPYLPELERERAPRPTPHEALDSRIVERRGSVRTKHTDAAGPPHPRKFSGSSRMRKRALELLKVFKDKEELDQALK
ncbi:unnamed protein product [Trichogramma brassicae]|uniref:Uncharacterized protein n=1 Tax=Trichogramma brassicae TaxID=86971 RepID=A0A6H5HSF5_9HYME|nr:unnamed protein product [Trichogramma brassicae]